MQLAGPFDDFLCFGRQFQLHSVLHIIHCLAAYRIVHESETSFSKSFLACFRFSVLNSIYRFNQSDWKKEIALCILKSVYPQSRGWISGSYSGSYMFTLAEMRDELVWSVIFVVSDCSVLGSDLLMELAEPFHLRRQGFKAWGKLCEIYCARAAGTQDRPLL